jgi:hypothetical protein
MHLLLTFEKIVFSELSFKKIMKKQQNPYHFLDTFCFRTPLFPSNFILIFYPKIISKINKTTSIIVFII